MIRLASTITRSHQLLQFHKKFKNLPLGFHSSMNQDLNPIINQSVISFVPKFMFGRKKKEQDLGSKFDESLDNEYKKERLKKKKFYYKNHQEITKLTLSQLIGLFIATIFIQLHLTKKDERQKQKYDLIDKQNQRKRAEVMTELVLRDIISKGDVLNLELELTRKKISIDGNHYLNYCFLKRFNERLVFAQIISLLDFLTFVENLPQDFKVNFEYEAVPKIQTTFPLIALLFNGLMILGAFWILKRINKGFKSFMGQGGQNPLDFDNKKIEAIKPQNINTLFKDVAGMHEAKFQITEFVDFLKQPEKYIEMGAKVPKGALLTGPPGTGKTLLARACAGQAGVPFYYVSGSDFVEKYVGLGASRVRKLFDEAEKNAPSIIFIDEIDAIGKKRDSGPFANEERDNTLNQLLVRMDGFDSKNKVIVMAATNIKDTLDPALLRPGRFDRSVEIGLPNFEERKEILQVHLQKVKFDSKFTIEELANRVSILTPGFSGAELANICNEAAILAAREGADSIDMPKFQKATERVMAGLEKRNLFSEDEKLMLAYYECGKAVVGWFTEGSDPIIKLSILPFSKASKGYSHTIKDEIGLTTQEDLLGKVCFYLAGRASQMYFKQYVTTNGDADLKRAKRIISLLVTKFGMSERLKHIAFPDIEFVRKPYSSEIEIIIDQEIERISNECKAKVEKLIEEKKDLVEKLKVKLLEKESLNHNQIKEILGQRPFVSTNQNYQKYVMEEQKAHQQNPSQEGELLKQSDENGQDSSNSANSENSTKDSQETTNKFLGFKSSF